jgi:hypothetical protein
LARMSTVLTGMPVNDVSLRRRMGTVHESACQYYDRMDRRASPTGICREQSRLPMPHF